MQYSPPQKILEKYADVLVNFALGGGKGIQKGEVVHIMAYECTKPLYAELRKAVWKSGGHVISDYRADYEMKHMIDRDFYLHASDEQLKFFPAKYLRGLIDEIDHSLFVLSDTDMHVLEGIPPQKMMMRGESLKPFHEWKNEKENKGKFTWTIGLFGTEAMAREAGLSLKDYWEQIIEACFLNDKDPIAKWKKLYRDLESYRVKLNNLKIEKLHVVGPDADLWVKLGEKRAWMGGSGRNIPSFELFTSPDWRGTEGWIRFNQPLYRYGTLVEGIELEFKGGRVVKSSARKNEKVLQEMIATRNADKVGEFSLTDRRFSRIDTFMANTLFDENIGGPHGNTHIALGNAYHDCFEGDPSKNSKKEWARLGYNDSSVHTDVISTAPRTVTAYDKKGKGKVIYKDGQFII
ncbi:MAG: aminopeptidase [Candidatus Taylorbacteria bacterium]